MKKKIKRFTGVISGMLLIYLLILVNPSFLFANKYQYRNFHIHSDRPIPQNIEFVIDDAISRLGYSELFNDKSNFKLFLCNDNWRFKLFTRNGSAGGVVNFLISPNIFIRECSIETNEIIPPNGWMYTPKERPLSYFIAHEATHSLQRNYNSFLQITTPSFILEGYADYIAKRPDFSFEKYKSLYLEQDFVMNPQNGLYHKYHFYIACLMDKKNYSFKDIIKNEPDLEIVLQEALKDANRK